MKSGPPVKGPIRPNLGGPDFSVMLLDVYLNWTKSKRVLVTIYYTHALSNIRKVYITCNYCCAPFVDVVGGNTIRSQKLG